MPVSWGPPSAADERQAFPDICPILHISDNKAISEVGPAKTDERESWAVRRYFKRLLQGIKPAVHADQLGVERTLRRGQQTRNFGAADACL